MLTLLNDKPITSGQGYARHGCVPRPSRVPGRGQRVRSATAPPTVELVAHPGEVVGGPTPAESSTWRSSERSTRSVANSLNSTASVAAPLQCDGQLRCPPHVTPQSAASGGMASRCPHRARTVAADLAPQPGNPGNPSALSPTRAR